MASSFLSSFSILPYEEKFINLILILQEKNKNVKLKKNNIFSQLSSFKIENENKIYLFKDFIENLFLYNGDFSKIKIIQNDYYTFVTWNINSHLYITGCRKFDFLKKNGKPIKQFSNKKSKNQLYFFNKNFKVDADLMLLYNYVSSLFYKIIKDYTDENILENIYQNKITFTGYGQDACFFQLLALDLKLHSSMPFYIDFLGFEVPRKYNSNFEFLFRKNIEKSQIINTNKDYKNKSSNQIQLLYSKLIYKSNCILFWRISQKKEKKKRYSIYDFAFFFKIRSFNMPEKLFIKCETPTHMKITKIKKESVSNQI